MHNHNHEIDGIATVIPTNESIESDISQPEVVERPSEEIKEMTELEKLTAQRTGFFKVSLSPNDIKWIKNACNDKFEFTGPNEAFMVMNCYLGFSSIHNRMDSTKDTFDIPQNLEMNASAIEGAAILLNKYKGHGIETAQRVFRIAVALNKPAMEMKDIDQRINILKLEKKVEK